MNAVRSMTRRAVLGMGAAAAFPLGVAEPAVGRAGSASSMAGWTWQLLTPGSDIWMRNYYNGVAQFDFRLGAGGCVPQMRYAPNNFQALLAPQLGTETDRVMQAVLWGLNVVAADPNPADRRWNVNQAGNRVGQFTRVVAVQQPTAATTDVYTIADRQWYPGLQDDYAGSDTVPQLTRYTRMAGGVLHIRRVVRLPRVVNGGVVVNNAQFYLENWLPFMRSSQVFSALALGLDGSGAPNWWYRAGFNIPDYPWTPTANTNGYAVVYKEGAHFTTRVVGVTFSQSAGQTFSTSATMENVLNSLDRNDAIMILPGVRITGTQAGSILDYSFRIVTSPFSNVAFVAKLQSHSNGIQQPALYGPSYPFTGALANIVNTLRNLVNSGAGTRTNHLAPLLS